LTESAATVEKEPPEKAPVREKSFWASFTAADMRTLIVTVAGTVIGGTLLVMVLAVAVIAARHMTTGANTHQRTVLVWYLVVFGIVGVSMVAGVSLQRARQRRRGRLPTRLWVAD
jgi:uncharacterized membrane protein YdbT with pleckstrin-like domain